MDIQEIAVTDTEDLEDVPEPEERAAEDAAPDTPTKAESETTEDEPEGKKERTGPGEHLDDEELQRQTLALLFASPQPLGLAKLVQFLERPSRARVRAVLAALQESLDSGELPFCLTEIAGGWRLMTDPSQGDVLARLRKEPKTERITSAALETLAIVAYRQPVTKAEVEAIRGVQSGPLLRSLTDRGLVRVTGRADQPGSPLQYGTTRDFLDRFGLGSLKDLPRDGELASND